MRTVLLGKNSQVGGELQRGLAPLGVDSGTEMCGDFTDVEGAAATVRAVSPDIIVNAAGLSSANQSFSAIRSPPRKHPDMAARNPIVDLACAAEAFRLLHQAEVR